LQPPTDTSFSNRKDTFGAGRDGVTLLLGAGETGKRSTSDEFIQKIQRTDLGDLRPIDVRECEFDHAMTPDKIGIE
jgi:hypothetical protein